MEAVTKSYTHDLAVLSLETYATEKKAVISDFPLKSTNMKSFIAKCCDVLSYLSTMVGTLCVCVCICVWHIWAYMCACVEVVCVCVRVHVHPHVCVWVCVCCVGCMCNKLNFTANSTDDQYSAMP